MGYTKGEAQTSSQRTIGIYQLGELFDKGGSGNVYRGLNPETGQVVAIKQVSLANTRSEALQGLQREINLLKKLNHRNIVSYIDSIQTETHLNIVLEYIETGSLAGFVKKFGPHPESLVARFIKQVLTGVAFLHAQGVVHRDIKGANILATKDGVVKLADFGVSAMINEVDGTENFVGTPFWMAPEVIDQGGGQITTSCDIWSIGITVIELLHGNPPYYDFKNEFSALYRILNADMPPLPEGISPELKDFLTQCFQKKPSDRPDAKTLLNHPWIVNADRNSIPLQEGREVSQSRRTSNAENNEEGPEKAIATNVETLGSSEVGQGIKTVSSAGDPSSEGGEESEMNTERSRGSGSILSRPTFVGPMIPRTVNHEVNEYPIIIAKEIQDLIKILNSYESFDQIVDTATKLIEAIKENSDAKKAFVRNQGIIPILEILEFTDNVSVIHTLLQLINHLIESNNQYKEIVCMMNSLPTILKFGGSEYTRDIRVEVAYFVGHICQTPTFTLQLFIACGGLQVLVKFIDLNFDENKDLIKLSIECILVIYEMKTLEDGDLSRILARFGLLERLVLTFDNLNTDEDPNSVKYLHKCADIFLKFSMGNEKVKEKLCSDEVTGILIAILKTLPISVMDKILRVFLNIVAEPVVLNKLENLGLVATLVNLISDYKTSDYSDMLSTVMKTLYLLCKMNSGRLEQAALAGVIPCLKRIVTNDEVLKKYAIQILCNMVNASKTTRRMLGNAGGPVIFTELFKDPVYRSKALDSIAIWLNSKDEDIENILCEKGIIQKVVFIFRDSDKTEFEQIVNSIGGMLGTSVKLCKQLGNSQEFIGELIERLGVDPSGKKIRKECENPNNTVRKEVLEILENILSNHPNPKELISHHDLYPIIVHIVHEAQSDDLVIIEEIASKIMEWN